MFPLFLKDGLDYPDYLYAFGGKPFLMLTAIRDFFPIGGARSTFDEVRQRLGKLGLADHIAKFEYDDGHGYNQPRRRRGTAGSRAGCRSREHRARSAAQPWRPRKNFNARRPGR